VPLSEYACNVTAMQVFVAPGVEMLGSPAGQAARRS
jgi:hypothetical protein